MPSATPASSLHRLAHLDNQPPRFDSPPENRGTIDIKDGMLVINFRQTSKENGYENIRITETERGVLVQADKQVWVENGWIWSNVVNTEGHEYINLPRDLEYLHPTQLPLVRSRTQREGWPWARRWRTEVYINEYLIRVQNRPRHFEASHYVIIR